MEYTNIIAAVPQGESFDPTAVNEGVWVSQAHLNNIETVMANGAAANATLKTQFDSAVLRAEQAETNVDTSAATIEALNATIAEKDAEIATLKAAAAATVQKTTKENDDLGDGKATVESEITKEAQKLRAIRDAK